MYPRDPCAPTLLHASQARNWPRHRFYWGYFWNTGGNRVAHPIRDVANKSHMPVEQVGTCALLPASDALRMVQIRWLGL